MNQTLGTAWACPYPDCPCVFVSPNARRIHLEEAHDETVDVSGAQAAVQQLHEQLARLNATRGALPEREAQS